MGINQIVLFLKFVIIVKVMRSFIAIELSEEQKTKLGEFQEALKKCGADLKIVERENLHLTLRFLGEITENDLEEAKKGLERAVKGEKSFIMGLKNTGVFPTLNYIKVVWAGIEKGKLELGSIAEKINREILVGAKDSRGFSAHITVARVKSVRGKENLAKVLKDFQNFDFGETAVSEVKIKESKLSPKGPEYSDIFVVKLS